MGQDLGENDIHFYRHLLESNEMIFLDLNLCENQLSRILIFLKLWLKSDLGA